MTSPRPPARPAAVPDRRAVLRWAGTGLLTLGVLGSAGCAAEPVVQVSGDAPQTERTAYRRWAEQALDPVRDLWGEDAVPLPVRLHLPADAAAWGGATGQLPDTDVPASTVTRDGVSTVVVHPRAWTRLTETGRAAVLTHEVTHLAQGSAGATPWWLGEGSAEFTAHRHSPLPPEEIAGPVWGELRGNPPLTWPRPDGARRWAGYAAAWSVALVVAADHGDTAVPALYRAVADEGDLDRGCRVALGRSARDLRRAWTDSWRVGPA